MTTERTGDNEPTSRRSGYVLFAAVALCVVVAVGLLVFFLGGFPKPMPQRPFDASSWKLLTSNEADDRGRMIDSLVRDHLRLGMNRRDVEALLGRPDYAALNEAHPHPAYVVAADPGGFASSHSGNLLLVYGDRDVLVGWWTPWDAAGVDASRR